MKYVTCPVCDDITLVVRISTDSDGVAGVVGGVVRLNRRVGPESPRAIVIQCGILVSAIGYLAWHALRAVAEGRWP